MEERPERNEMLLVVGIIVLLALGAVLGTAFFFVRGAREQQEMALAVSAEAEMARAAAEIGRQQAIEALDFAHASIMSEALLAVEGVERERVRGILRLAHVLLEDANPETDATRIMTLATALADDSAVVRSLAATTLGALGARAAPAMDALLDAAIDDPATREAAFYALGNLGKAGTPALKRLEPHLQSDDPRVRELAARAMAAIRGE